MIQGWKAVYYREALLLRRRFWKTLGTMSVSPLLYILAFGWAMAPAGQQGGGMGADYLRFLLPGLAAMSSMTQAWAIAGEINIARFYWRIFEEIQAAPVAPDGYVLGEVLAGMTRAFLGVLTVLAAAIVGHADAVVTVNNKDFPRHTLAEEGLERIGPDQLLYDLWLKDPNGLSEVATSVLAEANRLSGGGWELRPLLKKARLPRLAKALMR